MGSPQRNDQQRASGGDDVVKQNEKTRFLPRTRVVLQIHAVAQMIRPRHGAEFDRIKKPEQRKGRELSPKSGRHNEPQNQPNRHDFIPHNAARVGRIHVLGGNAARPPTDGQ